MKSCLIKQPAGLGDVFFLQKIAHVYREKGYKIVWPLRDDIFWVSEYIPDVEWYKMSDDFPGKEWFQYAGFGSTENFVYIDTFTADVVNRSDPMMSGTRMMSGKYRLVGLDHTDWGKYFKFNRNTEKENELYYDVLGLKDDSEYAYVNDIVTTDIVKTGKFSDREFDYPVVNNQIIDGYSLFDWVKVWENAKEIHTQCSGLCFIIDVIDTKGKVFYYPHDERQYKDLIDSLNNVYEWKLEF